MHKDPSKEMTPEMKAVYDDFYANAERLRAEWNLCTQQYNATVGFAQGEEQNWEAHIAIRRISDYWMRRRSALERAIPTDMLESFKSSNA